MRPDRRRARRLVPLLLAAVAASAGCGGEPPAATAPQASASRHDEVAERGASVMPFDLDRTTHRFGKTADGGVQTVVADDPDDQEQVTLVRAHLAAEADRFRRGDFTDPGRIHGTRMPGLDALRGHGGRIRITYRDTADGGRITYATTDPALVAALHHWFDAQVEDHGPHATPG